MVANSAINDSQHPAYYRLVHLHGKTATDIGCNFDAARSAARDSLQLARCMRSCRRWLNS